MNPKLIRAGINLIIFGLIYLGICFLLNLFSPFLFINHIGTLALYLFGLIECLGIIGIISGYIIKEREI